MGWLGLGSNVTPGYNPVEPNYDPDYEPDYRP